MNLHQVKSVLAAIICACLLLIGCSPSTAARPTLIPQNGTVTPFLATSTPMPTFTPTLPPLGSEANPLVMAVIANQAPTDQLTALDTLTNELSESLNLQVIAKSFPDYFSLESALQKGQVHLAWLQPVEYLLVSEKDLLSSHLVTNHLGVTAYGIQFLSHRDSNFTSYYDMGTMLSTTNAVKALAQFSGLRPCLTSDTSLAGYWLPLGYLKQNNIPIQEPVLTYSYSANLRALYIKGVCDFTATYAISGDPRSSSEVITDLQDVMARLPIIWISPAVIPNLNLSIAPELPLPIQTQISEFLLNYSRTETGRQVLSDANQYSIAELEPLPDDAYTDLRLLLEIQDVRLPNLVPSAN
ncbi:MAG: phosphate/phosphite/phosphonate ABC transporter substrate-binding protein [Anaerolineaceae bacterium]